MTLRQSKPKSTARKIPVRICCLILVLWIGSVGCFAACTGMMTAQAASKHACCKITKHKSEKMATGFLQAPVENLACCRHNGQSAAFSKQQLRVNQFTPIFASGQGQVKLSGDIRFVIVTRTFLPDRGGTYLRDCTLLI